MAEKEKQVETAPDPDEDDLDDLDDVLDEFQAKPKASTPSQPPPASSGPGRPPETAVEDAPSEEELSAQLQDGMKGLIGELGDDPEMQQKFEEMMQELIAAGAAPSTEEAAEHIRKASDSMPKEHSKEGKKEAENFQDTVRRTMERMQQSGDKATAASSSGGAGGGSSEEELLAQMMKELGAGGMGGGGEGSEEDFNKMLLGMMSSLTNKEILYEPMKELDEKFPAWMEKNKGSVEGEEMRRFEEQQRLVGEIVGRFERSGYSDEDEGDREFIVERMQKMQAAGSPPPDLVGDMSAAQEAMGDLDAGCPTQ